MTKLTQDDILIMNPLKSLGVPCVKVGYLQYKCEEDIRVIMVDDIYYFTFYGFYGKDSFIVSIKKDDLLSFIFEIRLLGYLRHMKTGKLESALKKL